MTIYEFFEQHKDDIFRFVVYKRFNVWTPYEQEKKYCDESIYEDMHYEFAYVTGCYQAGGDDYILELDICDEDTGERFGHKRYLLFSQIDLHIFDCDKEDYEGVRLNEPIKWS